MQKNVKTRLIIAETDKGMEIIIPAPRFNNPIAVIFTTINVILIFPLSAIALAFYYSEFFYKIALIIFSIPWVGVGIMINFILLRLFTDRTLVKIDYEQISFEKKIKRVTNSFIAIQVKEIINLKILKADKGSVRNNIYPGVFIVTEKEEYSLYKFTNYIFTNEEVVFLADEINKYIKKPIVEEIFA